jgi:hypothetical protein
MQRAGRVDDGGTGVDADRDAQRLRDLLLRCAEFMRGVGVDGDTAITP